MRKLALVNFIQSFFASALAVALPLYLMNRGISLEEIGIILSLSPLVFLLVRTLSAMVAEVVGTRLFFLATSASEIAASLTYMLASTPAMFGLGKFFEGSAYSFFWSVNRTKVIQKEESKDASLAKLLTVRMVAATAGIGAAGFLMSMSFALLFQVLAAAGMISLATSYFFWKGRGSEKTIEPARMLDPRQRGRAFQDACTSIFFLLSMVAVFFSFLLPIYMHNELMLPYEAIGGMLMMFYLAVALGSHTALEFGLGGNRLLFFQDISVPLIFLIPFASAYIFPLLLLIGFGLGVSYAVQEKMIVKAVGAGKYVSVDVALLHAPGRVGEFAAFALCGFAIVLLGSTFLFAASALLFALFVHFSRKALSGKD